MSTTARTCASATCDAPIDHLRADARFCSGTCRYKAWEATHPEDAARRRSQRLAAYRASRTSTATSNGVQAGDRLPAREGRRAPRRNDLNDRRVRVSILPEDDRDTAWAKIEAKRAQKRQGAKR